jgi:hypothetical protein
MTIVGHLCSKIILQKSFTVLGFGPKKKTKNIEIALERAIQEEFRIILLNEHQDAVYYSYSATEFTMSTV